MVLPDPACSQLQEQEPAGPSPSFSLNLGLHTRITLKEKDPDLGFLSHLITETSPFPCYMQIQAFYPESSTHEKNCEKGVQNEDSLDNEK